VRTFIHILLTTTLALLVWAWAEGEGLSTAPATPRLVFAAPPSSDLSARVVDPSWNSIVTVSLRGSNSSIGAAQRAMLSPLVLTPGVGAFPSTPGAHRLDLRDVLRASPEIRRTGVSIMSVEPATLDVRVDQLVSRQATVRLRTRGGELAQPAIVTPETVTLRFPAEVGSAAGAGVSAKLPEVLELEAVLDLATIAPGTGAKSTGAADVRVPVTIPSAWRELGVQDPVPAMVTVSFVRGTPDEAITLPSIPVVVVIDPDAPSAAGWQIELIDSYVRDVKIIGPAVALARLRDGKTQARAVAVVGEGELVAGDRLMPVTIATGVEGVRAEGEGRTARVRVSRKK
jgi:hypothetical protein